MDSALVVALVAEQRGLNPEKFLIGFGILRSDRHLGGETRELINRFVETERESRVLPVPPMACKLNARDELWRGNGGFGLPQCLICSPIFQALQTKSPMGLNPFFYLFKI